MTDILTERHTDRQTDSFRSGSSPQKRQNIPKKFLRYPQIMFYPLGTKPDPLVYVRSERGTLSNLIRSDQKSRRRKLWYPRRDVVCPLTPPRPLTHRLVETYRGPSISGLPFDWRSASGVMIVIECWFSRLSIDIWMFFLCDFFAAKQTSTLLVKKVALRNSRSDF